MISFVVLCIFDRQRRLGAGVIQLQQQRNFQYFPGNASSPAAQTPLENTKLTSDPSDIHLHRTPERHLVDPHLEGDLAHGPHKVP